MIRINLLPEEYRRKARTPIKLVLSMAAAVAVNATLGAWWAFERFGVQAELENEVSALQSDSDGLQPQVTFFRALESESKAYKSRESTLGAITLSRVSWTKKLDELVDVCNRGGNGDRHLVWLDDLQVTQGGDARSAKGAGTVRANGHAGSEEFAQVANFMEDLETSTFMTDFQQSGPPEVTQTQIDETLVPSVAWAFPMSLALKTPEERQAAEQARVAKQKSGGKEPAQGSTTATDKDAKKSGATDGSKEKGQ